MAGLVSPNTLEQIRAASDIVDVIGAVMPLKRAGANFVALCPFHKEKSPSFNVNPHKQIFHCFGCHKGGDVFTFIKEYENLSFMEAVRRLAERARIPLEFDRAPGAQQARGVKELLLQIHEQIAQRWQNALANDAAAQIARDYLAKRRVPAEAVKVFRLGYAPDAWDDTLNWAQSKNYDPSLMEQAGLIIHKEEGSRYYDRFRGRLMFPICDEQGRVIAFSGRVLSGDEKTAKYVNSPETPIFTKGKIFYGLDKSKRAILDAQCAVVCEGQLDLIACFMAGVQNVVAPQGTAFTGDHARILKRYVDEVVLCFDSDTAGHAAAARVLDSLLASGLAIRVATIPAPHDPDSFIQESGGAAFQQLIQQAPGFFDYYLERLCTTNDLRSDRGQLGVAHAMAEALHKTGNSVLVDKYAQKTALRLGISAEAMRTQFKRWSRSGAQPARAEENSAPAAATEARPSPVEFWLLKLLLLNNEMLDWAAVHLDLNWVQHALIRRILAARLSAEARNCGATPVELLGQMEDRTARSFISEALADPRTLPNPEQQVKDLVLRLRNQAIDRQITALMAGARGPEMNAVDLQRKSELLAAKKLPLTPIGRGAPKTANQADSA